MPKKTKKSKVRSEEETPVQQQQTEEEMQKKKEEMLARSLKDKLKKEQRNAAVNQLKLSEGWKICLSLAHDDEFQRDIMVLRQTFEQTVDSLDSTIEKLVGDLQQAERQEAQVQRHYLQQVALLWGLQERRLWCVQQYWEQELHETRTKFNSDRQQLLEQSEPRQLKVEDLAVSAEQRDKDELDQMLNLYESELAKFASTMEELPFDLELRTEVQENAQKLKALKLSDGPSLDVEGELSTYEMRIEDDLKNFRTLEKKIGQLREQLMSKSPGTQEEEQDLRNATEEMFQRTNQLRDQMRQGRRAARERLTSLAVNGEDVIRKLKETISKGERILRLGDRCRKLEEKINIPSLSAACPLEEDGEDRQNNETEVVKFPELLQLQQRVNAAKVYRNYLKKLKKDLSRENRELQLCLQNHDPTLKGHLAPLAIVRAPTTTAVRPEPSRCHTVIKGVKLYPGW
ncbi:dynein regulatory complex subunit 2-like [Pholidichthys leucotaenia]